MVGYSWPRVQHEKNVQNIDFLLFLDFYIDPGGPGAIQEGPEPIPELKNHQIYWFFKFFQKSMKNWFDPINEDNFLRWFSLYPRFLKAPIDFLKKIKFPKDVFPTWWCFFQPGSPGFPTWYQAGTTKLPTYSSPPACILWNKKNNRKKKNTS